MRINGAFQSALYLNSLFSRGHPWINTTSWSASDWSEVVHNKHLEPVRLLLFASGFVCRLRNEFKL